MVALINFGKLLFERITEWDLPINYFTFSLYFPEPLKYKDNIVEKVRFHGFES